MKTYLQISESKSFPSVTLLFTVSHSVSHIHPFTQRSMQIHNTEGILRGLCNKEHTKQSKYGCGMKISTHMHNNENKHFEVKCIGCEVHSLKALTGNVTCLHHTSGLSHHTATCWSLPGIHSKTAAAQF